MLIIPLPVPAIQGLYRPSIVKIIGIIINSFIIKFSTTTVFYY